MESTVPRRLRPGRTALTLVLIASIGSAGEIPLPLRLSPDVLRETLRARVFQEPGDSVHLWGAAGDCSFFRLDQPRVRTRSGVVRVLARGEARAGAPFLGSCLSPVRWNGVVEIVERPVLTGWEIRFEVVDTKLHGPEGEPTLTGALWDRMKAHLHPSFEAVTIDLGPSIAALKDALDPFLAGSEEARQALAGLEPRSVDVDRDGVILRAFLGAVETTPPTPAPEAPLTPEEEQAFVAHLDRWDAFLTFVLQDLAERSDENGTRRDLLAVLLDGRHSILEALDGPVRGGRDPVRRLFVDAWSEVATIASGLADDSSETDAIRLLAFVAAGDALAALDRAGPGLGIEISADGLRRMARILVDDPGRDPLESSDFPDARLRTAFGLPPRLRSSPPGSWIDPRVKPAHATATPTDVDPGPWLLKGRSELAPYLRRVGDLLGRTAGRIAEVRDLPVDRRRFLERLLPATAWQESCWRQFVERDGRIEVLRSSRGSVGILQINERVWRGFYAVDRLRHDAPYNALAGAEILLEYVALAERKGLSYRDDDSTAKTARAVYAAYNGGPRGLSRYLEGPGPGLGRVVDDLFGPKFERTAGGDLTGSVAACFGGLR